jgi:hypothetical protein
MESLEDRSVPTVVTVAALADAHEGGAAGAFRFTRDTTGGTLMVAYTVGGTATAGSDFTSLFGTVQFADGSSTADVTVTPTDDAQTEPTETVTATVYAYPGAAYAAGTPGSATVNILDNDPQIVSVEAVSDAAEAGDTGLLRFTRIGDLSSSLAVNYSSAGGTATAGTDFTALGGSVTFAAGASTADVDVAALHDTVYDPDETVIATVTSGTGYSAGAQDQATMLIYEDAAQAFTVESNQGAIWYSIPWGDVDADAASQSLTLSNFALTLAGHTFTESDASSAPTVQFENGVFVGVTFDIDTSGVAGYPYTSLSMSGLNLTAVPPVGDPFLVAAPVERASLVVNFKSAGGNLLAYNITVKVETQTGGKANATFTVPANATAGELRDAVYAALKDIKGIEVDMSSDDRLIVHGMKDDQMVRVRFDGNAIQQLNAIRGIPVPGGNSTPKLNINGTDKR